MKAKLENLGKSRLLTLWRSEGFRHGLVMSAAMILAGVLDYVVNVLAGRWLVPVEYGIFARVRLWPPKSCFCESNLPTTRNMRSGRAD